MTKEKIHFIQKNENNYNFCGIAYFVYYKYFQRQPFSKVVSFIQKKYLNNEAHIYYNGYCLKLKRWKQRESAGNFIFLYLLFMSVYISVFNIIFFLCRFSSMNIPKSQDCRGRGEHYPLHRHLDISQASTTESSPLYIANSRTRTGNLCFPSTSH